MNKMTNNNIKRYAEFDEDLEIIDDLDSITAEDSDEDIEDEPKKNKNELVKEILSMSLYLLVVLILTLLFVKFIAQRTVVQGESMMPTLHNQDNLIVDKISYKFRDPERFDIIVFPFKYEKDTYYIKRIIGLPGETVFIDCFGNIYINNEVLSENYGREIILDPGMASTEIVLGDDQYFVMGDNRNHSSDSRNPAVGLISREDLIGRAWLRIYPFSDFGFVKDHK